MSRKRTPTEAVQEAPVAEGANDFNPAEFESAPAELPPAQTHAAKLATQRKKVEHSRFQHPAGDLTVHYMDKAVNKDGIGVMVELPPGRKLTDDEKAIISRIMNGEGEQYPTGFNWRRDFGMWLKHFERPGEDIRDVPSNRIIAIRLDAEKRAERLAEALRHHQADPVGYREMITQQREQAASRDHIPS